MKIAICGANGHLGVRLIQFLSEKAASAGEDTQVLALVRRQAAAEKLRTAFPDLEVALVDYSSGTEFSAVLKGVDVVVNLVGIIKESAENDFFTAHEQCCSALAEGAVLSGVRKLVYVSIVGASSQAFNECLSSRANAENILHNSGLPVLVLRFPMVLGEGDYASFALKKQANSSPAITFRSGSLEQPIYAGDVIDILVKAIFELKASHTYDLAGPESLSRKALIARAAQVLGKKPPTVISLPLWLGMLVATLLGFLRNPPMTRAMLGILDHDDDIEVHEVCRELGVDLMPLDQMLERVLIS